MDGSAKYRDYPHSGPIGVRRVKRPHAWPRQGFLGGCQTSAETRLITLGSLRLYAEDLSGCLSDPAAFIEGREPVSEERHVLGLYFGLLQVPDE